MDKKALKKKLYIIIFEAETKAGKRFDIILLLVILLSVLLVMLESIRSINEQYGEPLKILEWIVTIFFSLEYILRIWISKRKWSYIFSFFGLVDLLSLIPTYLSLFITGTGGLIVIRALRLLRVFRILKLTRYTKQARFIVSSLKESRHKLSVFLFAILTIVTILGTVMYLIEGEENGFTSIPESIYWAIVTLTTVGYGDMTPSTDLGRFISSFVMILGYTIIAVPTGIIVSDMNSKMNRKRKSIICPKCLKFSHDEEANYCDACGSKLLKEDVS